MAINLNTPEFVQDPYPFYHRLREEEPVYWLPYAGPAGGMWLFTRYEDVTNILKDARLSKNSSFLEPVEPDPFERQMLNMDPPDHTRMRGLVNQAFTPRRISELEARIAAIVDDLLAQALAKGEMDFIADFALPLPVIVIAELLGVRPQDRTVFRQWTDDSMRGIDALLTNEERRQKQQQASLSLAGYFQSLIQERRDQPRNDLISGLIQVQDHEGCLSEAELLANCMLLLIAGYETTVNLLGNGMLALLQHPDQLFLLRQHPEAIPRAIEEMLRFNSPVQRATFRITRETAEIGGRQIEAGKQVSAVIGAANRDPAYFRNPDTFDVMREPNRHVAFGLGIHFCLGAPLARTEGRVAYSKILNALPNLHLLATEPEWNQNTFMRGLRSLPLAF